MKVLLTILFLSCIACSSINPSSEGLKPKAKSDVGEIILVMDSVHWKGNLGSALNKTFRGTVIGLPRAEPQFTIRQIQPQGFQSILKYARNIVVVYVMENQAGASNRVRNFFTEEALTSMKSDSGKFMVNHKNLWADQQNVLFLYGQTEEILADHLLANKELIQQHFNSIEEDYVKNATYKAKELTTVSKQLLSHHGFQLRIPYGWRVEYENENDSFVWLRSPGLDVDKSLWVSYTEYLGPESFDDPVAWRNQVTQKYIYDDKEMNDTSYVVIETIVPPVITEINFGGQYAKELRGLWKTKNLSMGGPFISYVVADPSAGRVYYLDGFVYSPGKSQRESVRELKTILKTFSVSHPTQMQTD